MTTCDSVTGGLGEEGVQKKQMGLVADCIYWLSVTPSLDVYAADFRVSLVSTGVYQPEVSS